MDNAYGYDVVSNVLSVVNKAAIPEKGKAGGQMSYNYTYDALYRLSTASGTYKGADNKAASYTLSMGYDNMHRITSKKQHLSQTGVQFEGTLNAGYELAYTYGKDAGRKFQLDNVRDINYRTEETPTESMNINNGHKYTYDLNGNLVYINTSRVKRDGKEDEKATEQKYRWDEENRLMVLSDNSKTSRYTYNAAGERIMKSYGTMEGVYINGAPQGITLTNVDFRLHQDKMSKLFCAWFALKFHETDNFTLYPASILSVNKNRFTKHYFIGDKRVASRIGTGLFNNVYGRNGSYVTAGQQDYAERMNQIQRQKEAYYKQQGIAPGVPTMKGAYGDPENTKRGYNSIIDTLGNHDVPQGWIQTPHPNTTTGTNPGPPISWNDPSNPDDPQAGYGYIPNDTTREETFFYHSDHLGSTSYITDDHANITQYDAYLPYGELLVDEHSSSEDLPYKFNGKQFDNETGLYYYGARYMNPVASIWYGVDPLAEKYVNVGGYVYCIDNPIVLKDPNGKQIEENKPLPQAFRYAKFVAKHPIATLRIGKGVTHNANNISTNSTRFATRGNVLSGTRVGVERELGSENGAFRHTLWQASITSEFDATTALEAGNAHEANPDVDLGIRTFNNLSEADQTVDLLNNQIGRRIGESNKNKNMKQLALSVLSEFRQNGLYTAVQKGKQWIVSKTRLSKEKYDKLSKIYNGLDSRGFTPAEAKLHDKAEQQKLESTQITWGTMK